VLALDILCALVRVCPSLFQYLAAVLQRFAADARPDDLLCAKARHVHEEVLALDLPPDVLALFERHDPRVLVSPQRREVRHRHIPGSASLPPRKADRKLPVLAAACPGFPVMISEAKPPYIHLMASQRRKRFSLIGP
jgi:hypothetical protein